MVTSEQVLGIATKLLTEKNGHATCLLNDAPLVAAFETIAKLVELETTVVMTREHLEAMEKGLIRKPVNPGLN